MRVVLDANVLVSAAISPDGVPAQTVREWLAGAFDLVVSPKLVAEVERGLGGSKLAGRVPPARVAEIVGQLRAHALTLDDPLEIEPVVVADPKDDFIVALARAAGAYVIVTGDGHLLDIDNLDPPAVTPSRFLYVLSRHDR